MIFRLWVPMLRLSPWQWAGWGTCGADWMNPNHRTSCVLLKDLLWAVDHVWSWLCSFLVPCCVVGGENLHGPGQPVLVPPRQEWGRKGAEITSCMSPVLRPQEFGRTQQGVLCLQCNSVPGLLERPPLSATKYYRKHIWFWQDGLLSQKHSQTSPHPPVHSRPFLAFC